MQRPELERAHPFARDSGGVAIALRGDFRRLPRLGGGIMNGTAIKATLLRMALSE